jgi:hypothetical protein
MRKSSGKSKWRKKTRQIDAAEFRRKVIQEEKEVAEHCRLYFEWLLNEGLKENDATESPSEGGNEENTNATSPLTRTEILRQRGRLVNGEAAGECGICKSWYNTFSG